MAHSLECRELSSALRLFWDNGDPYGSIMSLWFPIANIIAMRGDHVPDAWDFREGAGGPSLDDEDEYLVEIIQPYQTPVLVEFGDFLERLYLRLERRRGTY